MRPDPTDLLDDLADLLAESRPSTPVIVGVRLLADAVELHTHLLEATGDLAGFCAPPTWHAVGLVGSGRTITGEPEPALDDVLPESRTAHDRVIVAYLVDRDDRSTVRVIDEHGLTLPLDALAEGRVPDLCRRALGLPTPPPEAPVGLLAATWWLDRVLAARLAADLGSPAPDWSEVCTWHPVGEIARSLGRPLPSAVLHDPAAAWNRLEPWVSWRSLRWAVAAGRVSVPGVDPTLGGWFDDGAFCRWALAELPALDALLDDLALLVPGRLAGRLLGAVGRQLEVARR